MKRQAKKVRKANYHTGWVYIRITFCIFVVGLALFVYIDHLNRLTELRLAIPAITKETKGILEENTRLKYEIERFESPIHLMELLRKPEFSHLKYPYVRDVVVLPNE